VKIKSQPEDFQVSEIWQAPIERSGPVTLYELSKKSTGTIEAIRHAAGQLGVNMKQVFFAGIKDRHAATRQYVSIEGAPKRDVQGSGYHLRYMGGLGKHLNRTQFRGNRFVITIRDLSANQADTVIQRSQAVANFGVPNYFDDQRFGSLRGCDEFAAKRLMFDDAEGALRLVLASPSAQDRSAARKVKVMIRDNWGQWEKLKKTLPARARERKIIQLLGGKPDAFADAFEMIERNVRVLIMHAYQSFLFNEVLARFLKREFPGKPIRVPYSAGTFLFPSDWPTERHDALVNLEIPLPSGKMRRSREAGDIIRELFEEEGITSEMFMLKNVRRTRFSGGVRKALITPVNMKADPPITDELNKSRHAVKLSLDLPPGSYATIVLKRLTWDMVKG